MPGQVGLRVTGLGPGQEKGHWPGAGKGSQAGAEESLAWAGEGSRAWARRRVKGRSWRVTDPGRRRVTGLGPVKGHRPGPGEGSRAWAR